MHETFPIPILREICGIISRRISVGIPGEVFKEILEGIRILKTIRIHGLLKWDVSG